MGGFINTAVARGGRFFALTAALMVALGLVFSAALVVVPQVQAQPGAPGGVAARGRIEPKDGLYAVSGPSGPIAVVSSLNVESARTLPSSDKRTLPILTLYDRTAKKWQLKCVRR